MLRSLVLAAVLVGPSGPSSTAPAAPPYIVIAQGLVELTDGTYAWSHTAHELAGTELAIEPGAPAFVMTDGAGAVILTGSDGSRALLSGGEAVHGSDAAVTWTAIALAESGGGAAAPTTRLHAIAVIPAGPGAGAFAPGAGWHDIELRHIVVAAGTSIQAPPPGNPAFVMVRERSGRRRRRHDASKLAARCWFATPPASPTRATNRLSC